MYIFKAYRSEGKTIREVYNVEIKRDEILAYVLDYSARGFVCHVKLK